MDWTIKPIKDFSGYMVSSRGEVFTNKRGRKMYKLRGECVKGYFHVTLYKKGKGYSRRVHRLVAEAFIPNPDDKPFIDHIDADKQNNNVSNLRWCNYSENMRNPLTYKKINLAKERKIEQLDFSGKVIRLWNSTTIAAKTLGISKTAINNCLYKRSETSGGYKWRFV